MDSTPNLVPPKLNEPRQVTALESGDVIPPVSEDYCEIGQDVPKAPGSQQVLTKWSSFPTLSSCSAWGLWLLQGGPEPAFPSQQALLKAGKKS